MGENGGQAFSGPNGRPLKLSELSCRRSPTTGTGSTLC